MVRPLYVVVDGNHLAWRAHQQQNLGNLKTKKGKKSGVFYGFLISLNRLIKMFKPKEMCVVFDGARGYPYRREIYSEYKAQKSPHPVEWKEQVKDLRKTLPGLGIRVLRAKQVEGDDLIAVYARRVVKELGGRCTIVSADSDFYQLLGPHMMMYDDRSRKFWDHVSARHKLGTDSFIQYKALIGDVSDNIPGVGGVGPKRALEVLSLERNLTVSQQIVFLRNISLVELPYDLHANNFLNHRNSIWKQLRKPLKVDELIFSPYFEKYQCPSLLYSFTRKGWSDA